MAVLRSIVRRWGSLARCLLVLGLAAAWPGAAGAAPEAEPAAEYQVKAVFLFNFAQFVEWPATAFADAHAPLVIGVLGEDPFGTYLDKLVQSEKVGGRSLEVRRFRQLEDVSGCHLLFVGHNAGATDRMAGALHDRPVLTVGDTEDFSRLGGMVRFVTENGKIRLRINVTAAQEAGLVISSKLLRWATIVTPEKG